MASQVLRPMSAKVLPLKKRNGADRWRLRRKSSVSRRLESVRRKVSLRLWHAAPVSELIPCCAEPRWHAPLLRLTTSSQPQFLRKAARVCNGHCSPIPPREGRLPSDAPADPDEVSSFIKWRDPMRVASGEVHATGKRFVSSQGLWTEIPQWQKSWIFRVASVSPWHRAVAAIRLSTTGSRWPFFSASG